MRDDSQSSRSPPHDHSSNMPSVRRLESESGFPSGSTALSLGSRSSSVLTSSGPIGPAQTMLASVGTDLSSGGWGGHPHTAPGDRWEGSKLRVGSGGQCDRVARKRDSRKLCAAGPSV